MMMMMMMVMMVVVVVVVVMVMVMVMVTVTMTAMTKNHGKLGVQMVSDSHPLMLTLHQSPGPLAWI